MKKSFYVLVSIALMYFFSVSCNKTPTFEEMKAAEKKIIRKILSEKNFEVLEEYPENGVFGENQYVLLNSGIYLNVVDSGNGNRAVYDGYNSTDVLVRVSGTYYTSDETYDFNTFTNASAPFSFKFGFASSVIQDYSYNYYSEYYMYFSRGLESILELVGDSAIVKLLIPGHASVGNYEAGSSFQTSGMSYTFIPIYYDKVRYTFYK